MEREFNEHIVMTIQKFLRQNLYGNHSIVFIIKPHLFSLTQHMCVMTEQMWFALQTKLYLLEMQIKN
jgi:hypothetical protein